MLPNGFNPMRWKCDINGCFNIKRRPKIEVFADCFPRKINFGDVDGLVELNGWFCLLEWKGDGGELRQGQRRSYIEFTNEARPGNIVLVVKGNPETMVVENYSYFWAGNHFPTITADINALKKRIRWWVDWTEQSRRAA